MRSKPSGFDTDWTKEQSIQSTEHSAKRPSMRGSRTFRVTAVAGDGRSPGRALTIRTTVLAVLGSRAIAAWVRALFQFFFGHIAPFASVSVSHPSGDTQHSPKGYHKFEGDRVVRQQSVEKFLTSFCVELQAPTSGTFLQSRSRLPELPMPLPRPDISSAQRWARE